MKQTIRLTETQLKRIVKESIDKLSQTKAPEWNDVLDKLEYLEKHLEDNNILTMTLYRIGAPKAMQILNDIEANSLIPIGIGDNRDDDEEGWD